jgi:hypothetical protein
LDNRKQEDEADRQTQQTEDSALTTHDSRQAHDSRLPHKLAADALSKHAEDNNRQPQLQQTSGEGRKQDESAKDDVRESQQRFDAASSQEENPSGGDSSRRAQQSADGGKPEQDLKGQCHEMVVEVRSWSGRLGLN